MAVTIGTLKRYQIDQANVVITTVTGDSSYPTGGEAITANQLGMSTIAAVIPMGNPGGLGYSWDSTNLKLQVYFADYSTTTDAALIELPDTSSAFNNVVVPVLVIGV